MKLLLRSLTLSASSRWICRSIPLFTFKPTTTGLVFYCLLWIPKPWSSECFHICSAFHAGEIHLRRMEMCACEDKYLLSCLGTTADKSAFPFQHFWEALATFFGYSSKHEYTVILRKKLMTTRLFLYAVPFSPQTSSYPPKWETGKQNWAVWPALVESSLFFF